MTDGTGAPGAPLRVLAADDVEQNRELLARLLEREGHRATVVANGAALLAHYEADPAAWDVVLLDLHMPGLDGVATCERLRAWERAQGWPPVPVLALSASVLASDRAAALHAGMDGFVDKPIDPQALRRALAEAGRRRHGPDGPAAAPPPDPSAGGGATEPPPETPRAPDGGAPAAPAPPVADPANGRALWGGEWVAQVQRWYAQQAPAWADVERWDRAAWHRIAGAAANLALPALALAAREQERTLAQGQPADPAAARQAWQALTDWLAQQAPPPAPAPAMPPADALSPPGPAAAALLRQIEAACRRGELDEAALAALAVTHPAHAAALREALDAFDFDTALARLAQWRPAAPHPEETPTDA